MSHCHLFEQQFSAGFTEISIKSKGAVEMVTICIQTEISLFVYAELTNMFFKPYSNWLHDQINSETLLNLAVI